MRLMILLGLALALPFNIARAQADDSRVTLIGHDEVASAFSKGKPLIEVADYKIHASRRDSAGIAEIHTRDTDIAYVLQGAATLVTGGTAVGMRSIGPEELRGVAIEGGNSRRLVAGDVVVIPNGVPHWFKVVKRPFLYYVVKVRQANRQTTLGAAR
ncbi:MAG TPA: cupin domain-containing protein [Gemmatimonadales bacterium]